MMPCIQGLWMYGQTLCIGFIFNGLKYVVYILWMNGQNILLIGQWFKIYNIVK